MERLTKVVKESGAVPVWISIPTRHVLLEEHSPYEGVMLYCQEKAESIGMHYINLSQPFREFTAKNPDNPLYRPEELHGHLSYTGHKVVAKVLYEYLVANNLLK